MLLIVKHSIIMFEWSLVRLSNLIYQIQKTISSTLFSYSQSVLAVSKTCSFARLYPFMHLHYINNINKSSAIFSVTGRHNGPLLYRFVSPVVFQTLNLYRRQQEKSEHLSYQQ